MRTDLPAALLATALASSLFAAPAQAAAPRTFLSAAGSDANNCTNVATPCRHMAAAYAATAANGEIYVLDPANYGSLTITGPVSIEGHGWASIAPPSGGNAITINANPGDAINIIGVVLDGTALAGTNGIVFNAGGSLTVRDSVVRNFTGDGILFQPNFTTTSQLSVSNTLVSDNSSNGIDIFCIGGAGTLAGVLDHVDMENNGGDGLLVNVTQTTNVTVNDSVSSKNGVGIVAFSNFGTSVSIMVRNSTIANNSTGLQAENNGETFGARIWVTRSTITENASGWLTSGNASVSSFADNNIIGNSSNENAPPTNAYK
jgi:hypothetical protein